MGGLGLCVLLKSFAIGVGVHLLGLKEQEFELSEILLLQALAEIREFLIGCARVPCIPNGLIEDSNVDLVPEMERHVLQAIEESTKASGLSRADAGQGANSLFGLDVVDADCKGESFVSGISAHGRNGQGDSVASRKGARLQGFPQSLTIEGGHSSIFDVKDGLRHPPVPEFRLRPSLKAFNPLRWQGRNFAIPEGALPDKMDEGELDST